MRTPLLFATIAMLGCEPAVIDHTPELNLLDADSASLEKGLGHWSPWFSAEVSRANGSAPLGEASLRADVTEPYGWGVQLDNWPGFAASPGAYRASFWARAFERAQPVTLRLSWRSSAGEELGTAELETPLLDEEWVRSELEVTAPPGTEHVGLDVTGDGDPGDAFELDGFMVVPAPAEATAQK